MEHNKGLLIIEGGEWGVGHRDGSVGTLTPSVAPLSMLYLQRRTTFHRLSSFWADPRSMPLCKETEGSLTGGTLALPPSPQRLRVTRETPDPLRQRPDVRCRCMRLCHRRRRRLPTSASLRASLCSCCCQCLSREREQCIKITSSSSWMSYSGCSHICTHLHTLHGRESKR